MSILRRIRVKTPEEIERMREAGSVVALILSELERVVKPGVTTKFLEKCAVDIATSFGVRLAFMGYRGFPAHICVSVNEEVVHGIPSEKRVLREGDIVSVDVGVEARGYFADGAVTYPVGRVAENAERLIR
ncbi:MAG: M24 family metallopeptidase, partial [Planctomycetota bacterium]|nr:M24 family metallopeptidase [Planctomycetota bacterium]